MPSPGAYKFFQIKGFTNKTLADSVINTVKGVIMENTTSIDNYKSKAQANLASVIDHLKDVLHLFELRDALQKKVDTYTVDNLNYDHLDHRRDCLILSYLNKKLNEIKRIKTNYQYA